MKHFRFLLMISLVTVFLAAFNYALVLKSFGFNQNDVIDNGSHKSETGFWENIKQINSEDTNKQTSKNTSRVQEPTQDSTEMTNQEKPLTSFLLAGDSIMYTFAVEFTNAATKSDFKFDKIERQYKNSTGLNRIDSFDWYKETTKLIDKHNPDAMLVIFGGNDDQAIKDKNGKYQTELTPKWKSAYQQRVEEYANLLSESSVRKIYWIGHPITNKPRYKKFFKIFNKIYQKVAQDHPKIEFVDNWDTFADENGNFKPIIADSSGNKKRVRQRDGVHLEHHGAKIIVDKLINKMDEDGVLQPKIEPEKPDTNIEQQQQPPIQEFSAIFNNYCPPPEEQNSYMRLEQTGRKNKLDNPLYRLCLYAEGQLQGSYDAVTGRAVTQKNNRNQPGTGAPLPDGKYRVANQIMPGLVPEAGKLFLSVFPTFNTARGNFGIHYDPSFEKNNGHDGTGGCVALTKESDLDEVIEFWEKYKPQYFFVEIDSRSKTT
ncbi:MAG: DUF459 domain-containing protein [Rivularia sp. (in: cyanobacteria)]